MRLARRLALSIWVLSPTVALAWSPPSPTTIVPGHPYDLAALIDLAEQLSPETSEAWNDALAAAAAAGIARSAYLPQLAVDALGGAQRTPLAAPSNLVPKGYFISDTREVLPTLTVKWLLFDFGRRDAVLDRATTATFIAHAAFTGAHQKLVYTVSHDYYALGAASGKLEAARKGLETAQTDNDAVSERRHRGIATSVEQARSDRQLAQARFAVVRAQGVADLAQATLVADIGLPAESPLLIASVSAQALPLPPAASVGRYVSDALAGRPDLIAAQGKIDAAEASIREASANFRPTIGAMGQAFYNDGRLRSDGGPWSSVHRPGGAVFLQFSWTLFDGGARRSKLALATAERDAAMDAYRHARDVAGKQVAEAFTSLQTALASATASAEVTRTATIAHDAALAAFRQGLGTFDELAGEANALSTAQADEEDARASAFTAAAALALATGQPTSASPTLP